MTSSESERVAARIRTAFDLHEFGVALHEQTLRRERPGAPETEIRAALVRWLHAEAPERRRA